MAEQSDNWLACRTTKPKTSVILNSQSPIHKHTRSKEVSMPWLLLTCLRSKLLTGFAINVYNILPVPGFYLYFYRFQQNQLAIAGH